MNVDFLTLLLKSIQLLTIAMERLQIPSLNKQRSQQSGPFGHPGYSPGTTLPSVIQGDQVWARSLRQSTAHISSLQAVPRRRPKKAEATFGRAGLKSGISPFQKSSPRQSRRKELVPKQRNQIQGTHVKMKAGLGHTGSGRNQSNALDLKAGDCHNFI